MGRSAWILALGLVACSSRAPQPAPAQRSESPAPLAAARSADDDEEAQAKLRQILERDPRNLEAHAELFERTGLAPRNPPPADPLVAIEAHPYDPWVHLLAGRAAATAGDSQLAADHFRWALILTDLDPSVAPAAAAELGRMEPAARERLLVPVHVYADETVRAHPGWRFRLRFALQDLSGLLDAVLHVAFLPAGLHAFDASGAGSDLDGITAAFEARGEANPANGILAVVSERPPLRSRSSSRLGEAQFLGRRLTARLEEGEILGRTLTHEVLHLYGAIHVSEQVDSLMNPRGGEWILQPVNAAILSATAKRRFGPGGFEANIFPYIHLDETIAAYVAALDANLRLRKLGIQDVRREARTPRARAQRMQGVTELDPHLGDVCAFTAQLLWRAERGTEAIRLLEAAAQLYGPRDPRGGRARAQADALRAELRRRYGLD